MSHRFHDVDRAGQTWEWSTTEGATRVFLVLGPRTPTTHRLLDLETAEQTHVWESVLQTFTAAWRRIA